MSTVGVAAFGLVLVVTLSGCGYVTSRSAGQIVNDVALTTQVKSRLATTEGMGTLTRISVDTQDDWVTLTGEVPDDETWKRIDRMVRQIAGDNRVHNQLTVEGRTQASPGPTRAN